MLGFLLHLPNTVRVPLVFPTQTKKSTDFFTIILYAYDWSESVEKTICHQVSKIYFYRRSLEMPVMRKF